MTGIVKCSRKHTNSIDPNDARPVTLSELKQNRFSIVYIKGNCGHWLNVHISGKAKTWKRDTGRVQVPYKYGLYEHGYITEKDTVLVPKQDNVMPYKRDGNIVYHKKNGRWLIKEKCKSVENAKRAIRFLNGIEHGMKPNRAK